MELSCMFLCLPLSLFLAFVFLFLSSEVFAWNREINFIDHLLGFSIIILNLMSSFLVCLKEKKTNLEKNVNKCLSCFLISLHLDSFLLQLFLFQPLDQATFCY